MQLYLLGARNVSPFGHHIVTLLLANGHNLIDTILAQRVAVLADILVMCLTIGHLVRCYMIGIRDAIADFIQYKPFFRSNSEVL